MDSREGKRRRMSDGGAKGDGRGTASTVVRLVSLRRAASDGPGAADTSSRKFRECTVNLQRLGDACRPITDFERLDRIGEGTYGIVYRGRDKATREIVAIKRVKMNREKNGLPISSLRELRALQRTKHPNVVQLQCVAVGRELTSVFLVLEYCEHDLAALVDNLPTQLPEAAIKCLVLQLVRGVEFLHDNHVVHRDLKLSNLLLTEGGVLKICDFGLARDYGEPPRCMSPTVVTLWYRAPELLLGEDTYGPKVDCWAVGCILGELLLHEPLMPGKTEAGQLDLIESLLGTPNEAIWPGVTSLPLFEKYRWRQQPFNSLKQKFPFLDSRGLDLLHQFLTFDPKRRASARSAWQHTYFTQHPLPCAPSMMPTFPVQRNTAE
eukprot:m.58462 g.58462  ORF g.58462 m.58462 type:complete len:379 (-) comp12867_c0_seq2:22-1158(-)